MQTSIHDSLQGDARVQRADAILRSCVHCGFCTATCPTYQVMGDELDGPRGRIYLIKNLLETNHVSEPLLTHLDRCLTCRSCETTCPSGVEYGHLLDIGRELAAEEYGEQPRDFRVWLMTRLLPSPALNKLLFLFGRWFRFLLPHSLAGMIPVRRHTLRAVTTGQSTGKRLLLLQGCVQRGATPQVVGALEAILRAQGDQPLVDTVEGCCGALEFHLHEQERGRERARAMIDLYHDRLVSGEIDLLVSSASGCGVMIRDYVDVLQDDEEYAAKAKLVSERTRDASELIDPDRLCLQANDELMVVHEPCSLQHGQKLQGGLTQLMSTLGFKVAQVRQAHMCCGSAGAYSILQPDLAEQLRDRKLAELQRQQPSQIVTANIGCQMFLGAKAEMPVVHFCELIASRLET